MWPQVFISFLFSAPCVVLLWLQQLQGWCHCCQWVICLYKPLGSCEDCEGWIVTSGGGWKLFKTLQALHIYPFHLRKNYSRAAGIKQKSERRRGRPGDSAKQTQLETGERGEWRLPRQERLWQGSSILVQCNQQTSPSLADFPLFVDNYVDEKKGIKYDKGFPSPASWLRCCLVVNIFNNSPGEFQGMKP